jgi:hypothetical protein
MKKLETLVKDFESLTDDVLNEIVDCPDVDVTTLTDKEKFSCLIYNEMRKSLTNKSHELLLDCNYPQSNMHNKSPKQLAKGQEPQWLVDYYRLVSTDGKQKSLIQIYVAANPKAGTCRFNLCTSCAKDNLAQFIALRDELHFEPLPKKGGEGSKTTRRMGVTYDELVAVCKSVAAILDATAKQAEEAKKEKAKAEKTKKAKEPTVVEEPIVESTTEDNIAE